MKKILLNQYQVQLHGLAVRQKKVASGQTRACEKPDGSLLRRRNCCFLWRLIISSEIAREVDDLKRF